ncbi:MAG: DcaP family trimeric outer membrane transporter [Fimbriimonadales bacterium]
MGARTMSFAVLLAACPLASQALSADPPPRVLNTRFTFTATVPSPPSGKSLNLWIPIPSDNELQTITNLKVDSPYVYKITKEAKNGNRMIYVHSDSASGPAVVAVTFDVARETAGLVDVRKEGGPDARMYLGADRLVPITGRYKDIAVDVTGGEATAYGKVKDIFDHVVATMQYDYKKESPHLGEGDVAFVCDYKKGNCSDLHSYVISLARSQGVPAYLEYGFPITGIPLADPIPAKGKVGGYHCWTWFYDEDRGWLPVDASDARRWLDAGKKDISDSLMGQLVLERSAVAFSRGRDIVLAPKQAAGPLNNFIYPYAEADGKPVEAKWDLAYELLDPQDPQAQIDELRRIVQKQQAEIDELKGVKAGAKPQVPVTAPSGENVSVYGFVRADGVYDASKANNAESPQFINSGSSDEQFTLYPDLTRLGVDFKAAPGKMDVSGKIEIDFQGGGSPSRPNPRARHLYIQAKQGRSTWLVGQTWDLASPLFPSPSDDTLMWNAGNLGDRRAQIRYTYEGESGMSMAVALGLTGAIDGKDMDNNGVRDGEDSGIPNVQARLGIKGSKYAAGIWGTISKEETATPVGGETDFTSSGFGIDWSFALSQVLDVKGEAWTGSNLSDIRGGIGQGVNTTTGEEIASNGGWIELGFSASPTHRLALGYTLDDPTMTTCRRTAEPATPPSMSTTSGSWGAASSSARTTSTGSPTTSACRRAATTASTCS